MLKNVIDFIFLLFKSALLLAVLGVIVGLALIVMLIVIPTQVLNAFNILYELYSLIGAG